MLDHCTFGVQSNSSCAVAGRQVVFLIFGAWLLAIDETTCRGPSRRFFKLKGVSAAGVKRFKPTSSSRA
jgi:hypothetical protein